MANDLQYKMITGRTEKRTIQYKLLKYGKRAERTDTEKCKLLAVVSGFGN